MHKDTVEKLIGQGQESSLFTYRSDQPIVREDVRGEGGEPQASLLYLYSNNTIEEYHKRHWEECVKASCGILAPYAKRQAHALYLNADRIVDLAPSLDQVGFLTITTPDNCSDKKEFYSRFNSFNTNYFSKSPHFSHWLGVKERQGRGALHIHMLVHVSQDIRTGFDWDSYLLSNDLRQQKKPYRHVAAKCYRSATDYLNMLWQELRTVLPKYGLGRSELLPIRTNIEGIARYIGGYIGKHIGKRHLEDRGMRLIVSSRGWSKHSSRFSWVSPGAQEWRKKVAIFALLMGCADHYDLKKKLGPRWAYHYAKVVHEIYDTLEQYPEAPF